MNFDTVRFDNEAVILIDQRKLPAEETYLRLETPEAVAAAITDMVVRGAPAIGDTAAYGLALGALQAEDDTFDTRWREMTAFMDAARPTAVNLRWAVVRMDRLYQAKKSEGLAAVREALVIEAHKIWEEDVESCKQMGANGAELIAPGTRILTHCNAGALATGGYGTALGVIRAAHAAGNITMVYADETRPFLQGARLTAWELAADDIPVTVISDNMAGHLMARGEIDAAVVGSDRIAANGDIANKIGTYMVAVLCHRHGLPFYVAAPLSTIDRDCPSGAEIPIEERPDREVTHVFDQVRITPPGVAVRNPAFDVTPAELVTAIVTEKGVAYPPYPESIAALFEK
ncbi:MAG: S-methyl-5-thioribose-1-phosphate isomerase [Candidatus Lernaella stagnicola]|nr:S-methyl-5-thioribose-1-phosphate isomerase [Candidatus Lernaella stagnicola]